MAPQTEAKAAAVLDGIEVELVGGRWCGLRVTLQGIARPLIVLAPAYLDALAGNRVGLFACLRPAIEFRRLPGPGHKYAEAGTCGV